MKKILIVFVIIIIVIITIISISLIENSKNLSQIQKENKEYEDYLQKEIFGTEVISIINKAVNSNIKNEVEKDDKGFFIENSTNSIKVDVNMLSEGNLTTYQMETIQKVGIEGFIKNFNLIKFKCTNIYYHNDTKKVSKIVFEQIEE